MLFCLHELHISVHKHTHTQMRTVRVLVRLSGENEPCDLLLWRWKQPNNHAVTIDALCMMLIKEKIKTACVYV